MDIDELFDQIDDAWIKLNLDSWSTVKVDELIGLVIKLHDLTNGKQYV